MKYKPFKLALTGIMIGALFASMTANNFFNESGNAQAARAAFASVQGE